MPRHAGATTNPLVGRTRAIVNLDETKDLLAELVAELRALESEVGLAIGAAKAAGMSWAEVGEALGLTKQGAQQKWGETARRWNDQDGELRDRLDNLIGVRLRTVGYEIRAGNRHGELISRHRDEVVALRTIVDLVERWRTDGRQYPMPRLYKRDPGQGRNVRTHRLVNPEDLDGRLQERARWASETGSTDEDEF